MNCQFSRGHCTLTGVYPHINNGVIHRHVYFHTTVYVLVCRTVPDDLYSAWTHDVINTKWHVTRSSISLDQVVIELWTLIISKINSICCLITRHSSELLSIQGYNSHSSQHCQQRSISSVMSVVLENWSHKPTPTHDLQKYKLIVVVA